MNATAVATLLLAVQTSYTGLWYRLDSRSDDPDEKIEASIAGFISKATKGRQDVESVDPRALRRLRRSFDLHLQYPEEVYVEESEREIVLDDGGPRLRIYYLDGEKHERQMPNGVQLETTATRRGRQVDVFQETSEGAEIFETFQLSDDGEHMILTVRLEDKQLQEPLVIRSVYSRAP